MKDINSITTVAYETSLGAVHLDSDTVKQYLVRGNGNVSDQEVVLFVKLCQAQKLNPFANEAYLIKYGNSPATMVVGYDSYKRRAEENPLYLGRRSGIIVQRGNEIVKKEGTCLYPTEILIGGWCRVFRQRGAEKVEEYREVSLSEYQQMKDGKPTANWATKPATMIEKCAVSQTLRTAFPIDYQGLYTPEEMEAVSAMSDDCVEGHYEEEIVTIDAPITQEERQTMFAMAQAAFGKEDGNELIKELVRAEGMETTAGMMTSVYKRVMVALEEKITAKAQEE